MLKGHDNSWSWSQFVWAVSVVILLPNAVMWLFAYGYSLERPYVNVDYAIVMLILIANQRVLGVIALLAAFFFDLLALIGQVFPVLRLADVLYMAKFIDVAPAGYKILGFVSILVFLGFVFVFLFRNQQRNRLVFLACINVVILAYGVSAIFINKEETRVWSDRGRALISSQVIFNFDSRNTGFVGSLSVEGDLFGKVIPNGATKPWFENLSAMDDKVLLVVNESWGVSDERIQSAVMSPLMESGDQISEWQEGIIAFSGITVEAEIRELCQADLLHFNFTGHENDLRNCIPNRLKESGYETVAFHGAAGLMYDRAKWYPDIGFDRMVFFESHAWPHRCFSFPGACDVDMANHVANSYASSDRVFGYWLTLNTHHRYDLRDLYVEALPCDSIGVPPATETCRNLKLQYQFFKSLAGIISKPQMSGVRVVVVSDHEPRISNQAQMDEYFEKGKVPWVSFKVR